MKETKFKQTDIGLIPEDWKIDILDKAFQFLPTNTYAREFMDEKTGDVHNIHYGDILVKYGSIVDFERDSVPYLKQSVDSGDERNYLKNGDLIIADTAEDETAGKTVEIFNLGGKKAVAGLHTFACRPKIDFASKYLGYFSNCAFFHNQMLPYFTGTKVTSISKSCIKKIFVTYPSSKDEQERIANALSQVDDLLAALDEQIEKKKIIKQGSMQQLLTGKTRLKGFSKPWVEKEIEKIGNLTGAGVDKKINEDEIPVRLVNYLDVFHRDVIFDDELGFWVTANETKLQQCNVLQGDVFFTPSSEMPYDIALSAVAMESMDNVCYSYHVYRLRFYEKIDLKYKAYMFKASSFLNQANTTCEGSGKRYVISLTKFRKMKVFYPSDVAEQQAIANILSTMDEEIQTLQEERDKYALVKQGMMQQLLTGKIRLN